MFRLVLGLLIVAGAVALVVCVIGEGQSSSQAPRASRESDAPVSRPTRSPAALAGRARAAEEESTAELLARLTDADDSDDAAVLEQIRGRFTTLTVTELLALAFRSDLTGDAEVLRKRAIQKLEHATSGLRPIVHATLEALTSGDAHRRAVAVSLITSHCGRRLRTGPDGKAVEFLRPEDLDAARRALSSDVAPLDAKRSLLMRLGDLGSEAVTLVPFLRQFLEDEREAIRLQHEENRRRGFLVTGGEGSGVTLASALAEVGEPMIPVLVEMLGELGSGLGHIAALALEWMGAPAGHALIEAMNSRDPLVRRRAAKALKRVKTALPEVVAALERSRDDRDPHVRDAVAGSLAALLSLDTERLVAQLASDDPAVRWATVGEMGGLTKPIAKDVVDALVALAPELGRGRGADWYSYASLLQEIGPQAAPTVPHLLRYLSGVESRQTMTPRPQDLFAAIGPGAAPFVARALTGPDGELHEVAAEALAVIDSADAETLRMLAAHLEANPESRHAAVLAAALVGTEWDDAAVLALTRQLASGEDWDSRSRAAAGIGRMGRAGRPHLPDLIDLRVELNTEFTRRRSAGEWWSAGISYEVRVDAAIRAVGIHDLGLMARLLDHSTGHIQQVARETLEEGGADAADLLLAAWPGLASRGRWGAVKALETIGTGSGVAGRILDLGLVDEDADVRLLSADLASRDETRLPRAIAVCVTLALEAEPRTASEAVRVLGGTRDDEAVLAAVRPHLGRTDGEVRARLRALVAEIEDR